MNSIKKWKIIFFVMLGIFTIIALTAIKMQYDNQHQVYNFSNLKVNKSDFDLLSKQIPVNKTGNMCSTIKNKCIKVVKLEK